MADLSLPLSEADATIVSAAFLAGADKAGRVTGEVSWTAGVELAGRGSTLSVPVVARASISDYDPSTGVTFTDVEDDSVEIAMNQAKYWAKQLDDVRANAGAGSYLSLVASGAGADMAYLMDQYVLGVAADDAGVTSIAAVDFDTDGALYKLIGDLRVALADTGNILTVFVPSAGIVNGLNDTRFVAQGQAESHSGTILNAVGARIIETNAHSGVVAISDRGAIAGGTSLNKVDTTFRPSPFVRTASGLCVYGASVIKPECVAAVDIAGS